MIIYFFMTHRDTCYFCTREEALKEAQSHADADQRPVEVVQMKLKHKLSTKKLVVQALNGYGIAHDIARTQIVYPKESSSNVET